MILDEHTPCPACPQVVRDLFAVAHRAVLQLLRDDVVTRPEYGELMAAVDTLRPWVEAHHANQVHAFSPELEDARAPQLTAVPVDHEGSAR